MSKQPKDDINARLDALGNALADTQKAMNTLGAVLKDKDDIGEANERQSDFLWGWNDGEEGRAPRAVRQLQRRRTGE
jgi:hypothetical protein